MIKISVNNNIRYRVKFSKTDKMIYIGHLDLLKVTQRSLKRAKLPVAYSGGFNPHSQISFTLPLSLGVASVSEFFDIQLTEKMNETEIMNNLNEVLPIGMKILNVREFEPNEKNSAAEVEVGTYEIFCEGLNNLDKAIEKLLEQEKILIMKKTKQKTFVETDVKNLVYEVKKVKDNIVFLKIATGSKQNLKPELLIEKLYNLVNIPFDVLDLQITRTGMYKIIDDKMIDLM